MVKPTQLRMPFESEDEDDDNGAELPVATRRELREVIARLMLQVLQRQLGGSLQEDEHDDG